MTTQTPISESETRSSHSTVTRVPLSEEDQPLISKLFVWTCLAQFAVALFIYVALLLIPKPQIFIGPTLSDYALHAFGNTLLMLSTWLASRGRLKAAGPLVFVILFSTLMELAQGLTVNRTPDILDVVANLIGAFMGFGICLIFDKLLAPYLRR